MFLYTNCIKTKYISSLILEIAKYRTRYNNKIILIERVNILWPDKNGVTTKIAIKLQTR